MPLVESAGLRAHYLERGRGGEREPAALLLHSAGLGAGQWRQLMGALEHDIWTIAPNLRGYGRTSPWPADEPMNPEAELDLIDLVLAGLPAEVHLIGHSLGAWLALLACRRHPGRFKSLVLVEPVTLGILHVASESAAREEVGTMIGDFMDRFGAGDIAGAMERFTDYWYGNGAWAAIPAAQRLPIFARAGKMAADIKAAWADRLPLAHYASSIGDALVLGAENTSLAARRMAALLADTLPGATCIQIDGAGHLAPATHPDEVAALIRGHLARP